MRQYICDNCHTPIEPGQAITILTRQLFVVNVQNELVSPTEPITTHTHMLNANGMCLKDMVG